MMRTVIASMALGMLFANSVWAAEQDLVGHYSFESDRGPVVVDGSGRGHDGRAIGGVKWVKGPYGTALALDGQDGYVEIGPSKGLEIASAGTIEVWCCPKTIQGGLVNWSTGGGWPDERLVLAVNTYQGSEALTVSLADGKDAQPLREFGRLLPDQWCHLAITFDGESVQVYRDGLLITSAKQGVRPDTAGVPLWIGRCQGLGKEYFHGLIDEVRVYNRAFSPLEILASYKRQAKERGKDVTGFHAVTIRTRAYPGPGKIVATLDARAMQPLPNAAQLLVTLRRSGSNETIQHERLSPIPASGTAETVFDIQRQPAGQYVVSAVVLGPDGIRIGNESTEAVTWPGQPESLRNVKVLNNLVWELLNLDAARSGEVADEQTFRVPRDRWVFVRSVATVAQGAVLRISIDSDASDKPIIEHRPGAESTREAMRFLPAGQHTLHLHHQGQAGLRRLVVRAIPMLQHAFYGADPHVHPFGPYDWDFLAKDVLPNVNTMVSGGGAVPAHLKAWHDSGRRWITIIGLPSKPTADSDGVDKTYQHWSSALGLQHPLMSGIIVDEFGGGDDPIYDIYRQAVERIYANPQFKGKAYIPYGGTFYGNDRSRRFAKACLDGGGYIAWERYLIEQPTEQAARDFIKLRVTNQMPLWEAALPGCTERMILVWGYMSQPTESLNVDPTVDYRVYMDMQMHTAATHPSFFGLGGFQWYHSSYCDEENVRWAGRLFRYYAIEGHTDPLLDDPYKLTHVRNPDFADGLDGWLLVRAEEGTMQARSYRGYSWLQGRYPRTRMGDTFLWTQRSSRRPNVFCQTIKALKPGRLYSMKMITGDYQDLVNEVSKQASHAVTIKLDGVDVLPGPKKSFQFTFPNCYAHHLGKFDAQHSYWMNYHWRVFRAKAGTAQLAVTDWAGDTEPGGPIGQELMFNFIEIQPYIGD